MMIHLIVTILMFSAEIYLLERTLGKSKHGLSAIVLIILIFLLLAGNYENADTYNYEVEYNENLSEYGIVFTGYWGYYLLTVLGKALSINYFHFRFIVYGIGLFILFMAFNRLNINQYASLLLYMLFPMIIDSTQTKNFVAMALITLAITFLISGKIRDKIVFLALIILAGGFHPICYVYFPLVVCDSKKVQVRFVLPIVLFALVFANRFSISILSNYILAHLDGFLASRASEFFSSRVGGQWVKFSATAVVVILVYSMRKAILSSSHSTSEEKRFSNIVMYCALFSLSFLPLYFLQSEFARLLRVFFPAFHMLFIMFLGTRNKTSVRQGEKAFAAVFTPSELLIITVYFLLIVYMFYWDIYIYKDTVVMPFFTYNSVFFTS
ncbi:MAG: EpsG family protein [Clostridia bacterium]|nr:EpsG family protein [Clostridia bacterium]